MTKRKTDVHTDSCCTKHGCAFSDPQCSVTTHRLQPSHPCRICTELDDRYKRALKRLLIKNGTLVTTKGQMFGWIAEDYSTGIRHIRQCGFDVSRLEEDATWTEFDGTFTGHDIYKHGMEMTVTCTCGQYTDRLIRWDGRVADAIREIIELSD